MANTGDPYVYNVQQWVNNHFTGKTGYTPITENGKTGWSTIYALLHAFQISLGITATADNFGTGTANAFITYASKRPFIEIAPDTLTGTYETMSLDELENLNLEGLSAADKNEVNDLIKYKRICGIIQGALLCKGYSIGTNKPTGNFYLGTGNAIRNLKTDAGLADTSSVVTLNIMKALLSMDYFYSYDDSVRTQNIINMQRYLNRNYEAYIGLRPCDGVYGRRTSQALIYALQAEEGMSTSVANGNFGPSTKNCCPRIPYNNVATNYNGQAYSEENINRIITLLNIALYMNGFGYGQITSTYYSAIVKSFQNRYALTVNGICDLTTWLSIFISSGDISRSALACDCATPLNAARAQTLYNNGYRYVGRYITGTTKKVSISEMNIAFDAGLRLFPIFQTSANYVEYFTSTQGEADALAAYNNALELNIPAKTVIYFAVDCDPQDAEITNRIIPYFSKVYEKMKQLGRYKVGIYGTRNVCKRVSDLGYAVYSFVGDMSTGFSGNLGFSIPNNWSFDQFATVSVGNGDGIIEIDKDAFSGRDLGIGSLDSTPIEEDEETYDYSVLIGKDLNIADVCINKSNNKYNVYSHKSIGISQEPAYTEIRIVMDELDDYTEYPDNTNDYGVDGKIIGQIKPGDLFIRFRCSLSKDGSLNKDSVHKVIFKDNDGNVKYGYIQEVLFGSDIGYNDSHRYLRENFYDYNFDPNSNFLVLNTDTELPLREFTVSRELTVRRSSTGEVIGTIQPGTKVRGYGGVGNSYKKYVNFDSKKLVGSTEWIPLDDEMQTHAFVSLDMENGVNGYDRALW